MKGQVDGDWGEDLAAFPLCSMPNQGSSLPLVSLPSSPVQALRCPFSIPTPSPLTLNILKKNTSKPKTK